MKLRFITLLVVISLLLSLFLDLFNLFRLYKLDASYFLERAAKTALQIPLILFFASLWQRQGSENDQS